MVGNQSSEVSSTTSKNLLTCLTWRKERCSLASFSPPDGYGGLNEHPANRTMSWTSDPQSFGESHNSPPKTLARSSQQTHTKSNSFECYTKLCNHRMYEVCGEKELKVILALDSGDSISGVARKIDRFGKRVISCFRQQHGTVVLASSTGDPRQ